MIPKVIHYCWFGKKEKTKETSKYIESWKQNMPDYEIKEWNESNFDINIIPFVRDAYKANKFAFVSDYTRLWVLYNFGGIYFDTDVEVIKSFDDMLDKPAFMGHETDTALCTAVIGAEEKNEFISEFLSYYENRDFDINNLIPNPSICTAILNRKNIKLINKETKYKDILYIYPSDYFSVKRYLQSDYTITENTYSIHHFSTTWLPKRIKYKAWLGYRIKKLFNLNNE